MKRLSAIGAALVAAGAIMVLALPGAPARAGDFDFTVPDPEGDTFGTYGEQRDISLVSGTIDSSTFTLTVEFADDVAPPDSGAPNAVSGFAVFDTDQGPATGVNIDQLSPFCAGPLGVGADVTLQLFNYQGGTAPVISKPGADVLAQAPVSFNGPSFTATIPLSALGDDDFNFAVLVAPPNIPITDCAPGDGGTIDTTAFQALATATPTETPPATVPPTATTELPVPTAATVPVSLPVLGRRASREDTTPLSVALGAGALAALAGGAWRLRRSADASQ